MSYFLPPIKDLTATGTLSGNVISTGSTSSRSLADRFSDHTCVKDFGAVGDGVTNDGTAIAAADDASSSSAIMFTAGVYRVTADITIESDCVFMPGASLSINTGITVTFWGNVQGSPTHRIFSGAGSVVLGRAGTFISQRTPVYLEWWGAKADYGILNTDASPAWQKANDALVCGGTIMGNNGAYYMSTGVNITNRVDFIGAGTGVNPTIGGTLFYPADAFASGGQSNVLFNISTGSINWERMYIHGEYTTGSAKNYGYTAIKVTYGSGKLVMKDIEIISCGVGVHFQAGAGGYISDLKVYNYTNAGYLFGGLVGSYAGPYRFSGGIINNPNIAAAVSVEATAGTNTIVIPKTGVTAQIVAGMLVAAYEIPSTTSLTISSVTDNGSTYTLNLDGNLPNAIPQNAYIRAGYFLGASCMRFLNNSFDINFKDTEIAGSKYLIEIVGETEGAGSQKPDNLVFDNVNSTASTYNGVKITRGKDIQFQNSWIGDVPFGATFVCDAGAELDVDGVKVVNCLIGGGGTYGMYVSGGSNFILRDSEFVGNGQKQSGAYSNVFFGPDARGVFSMIGCTATNGYLMGNQGQSGYGIQLYTGAFSDGTYNVGSVLLANNTLGGTINPYLDDSAPTGTKKVVANNVSL